MYRLSSIGNQILNSTVEQIADEYVSRLEASLTYENTENLFKKLKARGLIINEAALEVFKAYVRLIRNMQKPNPASAVKSIGEPCQNTLNPNPGPPQPQKPNHDTCVGYREECKASMSKLTSFIDSLDLGGEERLRGGVDNEPGKLLDNLTAELSDDDMDKDALDSVSGIFDEPSPRNIAGPSKPTTTEEALDDDNISELSNSEMEKLFDDIDDLEKIIENFEEQKKANEKMKAQRLAQNKLNQEHRTQLRKEVEKIESRLNDSNPERLLNKHKDKINICKEVAKLDKPFVGEMVTGEHKKIIEKHDRELEALMQECKSIYNVATKDYHFPEKEEILHAMENLECEEPGTSATNAKFNDLLKSYIQLEKECVDDFLDSDDDTSDSIDSDDGDFDIEDNSEDEQAAGGYKKKLSKRVIESKNPIENKVQGAEADGSIAKASKAETFAKGNSGESTEIGQFDSNRGNSDITRRVGGRVDLCLSDETVSFSRTYI